MSSAIKTLTGGITAKLSWDYENLKTVSGGIDNNNLALTLSLLAGTGFGKVQVMFQDDRSVGSGTTNDDLDLSGVLQDIYGATLSFTLIKALLILNNSTTDGDNLRVGGAGTANHAWGAPFAANQDALVVVNAGCPLLLGAKSGLAVANGSSDVLRVAYAGVSGHIPYQIALLGN